MNNNISEHQFATPNVSSCTNHEPDVPHLRAPAGQEEEVIRRTLRGRSGPTVKLSRRLKGMALRSGMTVSTLLIHRTYAIGALMGGLEGECPPKTCLFPLYRRRSRRYSGKKGTFGEASPPQTPLPRKSCHSEHRSDPSRLKRNVGRQSRATHGQAVMARSYDDRGKIEDSTLTMRGRFL
jgi:hypothetical protein